MKTLSMNTRKRVAIWVIVGCALISATAWAQDTGARDYAIYCSSCHGAQGKGNGPAVYVIPGIRPTDLTQLQKDHGGTFPAEEIHQVIDGRKQFPDHVDSDTDMSLWGLKFQEEGNAFTPESEAKVKHRIDALVEYIRSIQEK
jgi:mono/diheme cytochrome c family protein